MENHVIDIKNISKIYENNTRALDNLSLIIKQGEWTSIMGPSGSGKTTLLNVIGCLDSPTNGKVIINGEEITNLNQTQLTRFRRENIGLIFQQYHLVPYLSALENVMMAQYYHSVVNENDAINALKKVQRVCIARALVNEPRILLADEPTGNLDQKNGEVVLKLIKNLHEEGHTIILITHNPQIGKLGDKQLNLVDGKIN